MIKNEQIKLKSNLLRELYALTNEKYKASSKEIAKFHDEMFQNGAETIWGYMTVLEESTIGIIYSVISECINKNYNKENCLDLKNRLDNRPLYYDKEILSWINIENKKQYPNYFDYIIVYYTMLATAIDFLKLIVDEPE